jgi:hypothetical protein
MPLTSVHLANLETAGSGARLSFAAVREDSVGDDFAIVQQYTGVVHHNKEALETVPLDQAVMKMHHGTASPLRGAPSSSKTSTRFGVARPGLCNGIRHRAEGSACTSTRWCRVHTPQFAQFLSHRVLT